MPRENIFPGVLHPPVLKKYFLMLYKGRYMRHNDIFKVITESES